MGGRAASGGASAGVLLAAVLPTAVLPMAVLPTVVPAALLATAPVQEHRWAEIAWKDGCMGLQRRRARVPCQTWTLAGPNVIRFDLLYDF